MPYNNDIGFNNRFQDPLDDILRRLRIQGIVPPNVSGPYNPTETNVARGAETNYFNPTPVDRQISDVYQPETAMQDRFASLLEAFPEREKPSIWRRIGASMAAFAAGGDPRAGFAFRDRPYNEAVDKWKAQITPAQQAADNEAQGNVNRRILAQNEINAELDRRRIARQEERDTQLATDATRRQDEIDRRNREQERLAEERIKVQQALFQIQRFKADNPEHEFITTKDGNIVAVNPVDPTKIVSTGLKSQDLSDAEKLAIGLRNDLTKIAATEAATARNIVRSGEQARATKETPSGNAPTNRPLLPNQETSARNNRVQQMLSEHPEWEAYIERDSTGKFIRTKMPMKLTFTGRKEAGDAETLRKINEYIFGATQPIVTGTTRRNADADQARKEAEGKLTEQVEQAIKLMIERKVAKDRNDAIEQLRKRGVIK